MPKKPQALASVDFRYAIIMPGRFFGSGKGFSRAGLGRFPILSKAG
jgi:hypothetical protein